jgi:neutral ceramidase
MKTWRWVFALVLCMTIYNASFAEQGNLRVGAAKVDITPSEKMAPGLKNVWGNSYRGIHDHTFVRAIVVGNGKDNAALVSIDTSGMPLNLAVRQRIQKETGVPAGNIMISVTHTHNAPAVGAAGRQSSPDSEAFTEMVEDAFAEAVHQAKAKQQLGRMVLAQGHADLNVNRDEFVGDHWKTGRNPARPSDKTVWVLRFDNTAGEPIAYMVNYGVHALTLGPDNDLVTGDFPGSTSRFIESYYKDKVAALWTSGPAGDQNLIATSWDLDDVLTHKVREPGEAGFQLSDALGHILGEEAIRAAEASQDVADSLRIYSEAKDVTCMGHRMDQEAYSHGELKFIDTQPQPLHLDLLMLDNIALAGVSAEVVTNIYLHLEAASPLRNTILMSLTKWAHNLYSR